MFTLQIISGISRVFQHLLKYFNGTIISISFALSSAGVFPVIFILNWDDSESAKLNIYVKVALTLLYQYLQNYLFLFISLLQLINGAQFLSITPLFFSTVCLTGASFPAPVISCHPLPSMYASL